MSFSVLGRGRIAQEVLGLLMSTPGQELHTREIARRVQADGHPVQRALEQLLNAGIVQSRRLGNLRLWSVVQESALAPSLRDLLMRTTGLASRLRRVLTEMRDIQLGFLFGSYASGQDQRGGDVDLFIVGAVDWTVLGKELASLGAELGREINPVVWASDELAQPSPRQARFLRNVLSKPRIWLIGDDSELERTRASVGTPMVRTPTRPAPPVGSRGRAVANPSRSTQRRTRHA